MEKMILGHYKMQLIKYRSYDIYGYNTRDRMGDNISTFDLVKQNIKQFFTEVKSRKESKRNYRLDKLIRNIPVDNSFGYEDFAPASKIENGKEYIKVLHWALKNEDVKNIALAGPYGSGKSSVIQSYLKEHPSTNALNISLATFDWEKKDYDEFKNEIELGILKQLFYKVDSHQIPQSRYRKIHKQYYRRFLYGTTVIASLSLLAFGFFFPETFHNCIGRIAQCGNYYHLSKERSYIIASIFGIWGIFIISYVCKWIVTHLRVKEVNIVDKATLSDEHEEDSIFNRNMDEIMYFFEETTYDTVFIEDLDRFDSSEIFVKLRELNAILNNYDLIKRRIVFVYAIKDDMFKDEERTKFFDFIIPVIPIINSTNSGEILIDKLKISIQEDGTYRSSLYDISSSYITLVSPFIEDMRVLTSICNEFVVYKNTLQNLHLKDEEMFSIMIFKNLFPSDFTELEAEKGVVKKAFEDKKCYVDKKIEQLKNHNEELLAILEGIAQDILLDLSEIKAAFLSFLTEHQGAFNYCDLDGKRYSYAQIMQPDFDMSVLNSNSRATISYYNTNGYNQRRSIESLKIEIANSKKNYIERCNYFQNCGEDRKEVLRKEIEDNEISILNLRAFSLKSLLEQYGTEEVLSDEVKMNKVLVFLLKKGFINENYADYINYFHPNSITSDEMNYIRGIRMEEAVGDFSYKIKNVAQVCDRIEDYEFRQFEAWNYDVTDYLITKTNCDTKCLRLFEGLAHGSGRAIEFIRSYIERNQNIAIFVSILCKQYSAFWQDICNNESFSDDSKFKYLSLIFSYAAIEDVVSMNKVENNDSVKNFIMERKYALAKLKDVSSEKMIRIIQQLDMHFACIDINDVDHTVLDYIFNESKYVINIEMVTSLFEYKYPEKVIDLESANYSTICATSNEPLTARIYDNFEGYLTEFVLGQETNVCEDIDAVEDILERLYKTNLNICEAVLDKENVTWEKLSDCCNCGDDEGDKKARQAIWNYVLKYKMIVVSWNNFMCYYNCYQLTSALVDWINGGIDILIEDVHTEQVTDEAIKALIVNDVTLDTFEKIIKKFRIEKFNDSIHKYTPEKINVMVKERYIPFSIKLLDEMEEIAPNSVKQYIVYNKEKFFDNLSEISLNLHTIAQLFSANELYNNEKGKLFDLFTAEEVDIELAFRIRELSFIVPKSYVEAAWDVLEEGDRYQLLLNQLETYSLDEISEKLSLLAPVYQRLADRTRRHREYLDVDDLGYNQQLLNKLKDVNYLTSVDIVPFYTEDHIANSKEKRQEFKFIVWVKKINNEL